MVQGENKNDILILDISHWNFQLEEVFPSENLDNLRFTISKWIFWKAEGWGLRYIDLLSAKKTEVLILLSLSPQN